MGGITKLLVYLKVRSYDITISYIIPFGDESNLRNALLTDQSVSFFSKKNLYQQRLNAATCCHSIHICTIIVMFFLVNCEFFLRIYAGCNWFKSFLFVLFEYFDNFYILSQFNRFTTTIL